MKRNIKWLMKIYQKLMSIDISNENIQIGLALTLLAFVIVYQFVKPFIGIDFRYEKNDLSRGLQINVVPMAIFTGVSILLVVFYYWLTRIKGKMISAVAIGGISLALIIPYSFAMMNGTNGNLAEISHDTVILAKYVQDQGFLEFITTYNDRGNPKYAVSSLYSGSDYAKKVYGLAKSLGLNQIVQSKWVGMMDTSLSRPYMHPPLFFLVLAAWQYSFGNTMFSAIIFMWLSVAIWAVLNYCILNVMQSRDSFFLAILFITLPTSIQDTCFPSYDVMAGLTLMLGYGLFILAIQKHSNTLLFFSGLAFGVSLMTRLTALSFIGILLVVFIYLYFRRFITILNFILHIVGLAICPVALLIAGYNPILTLLTAAVRQNIFYHKYTYSLVSRLPVFFYLGIPLVVLVGFGILKFREKLIRDSNGVLIMMPLLASIPIAITTQLTYDFPRNMVGVVACFILAISLLENYPKTRGHQSILIGINLVFVIVITIL